MARFFRSDEGEQSKEFYFFLKHNNYDFNKTYRIYGNLTNIQRLWLAEMFKSEGKNSSDSNSLNKTANKVFSKRPSHPRR